jgi:hypothetical protein
MRARHRGGASATGGERPSVSGSVDRDALLAALFPTGIPPREDVVSSLNAWLNEAERLARLR